MKRLTVFIFCLWAASASGQIRKIQWASSLHYQHNQYADKDYSGKQVIGPPDAFPPGRINKRAFRLSSEAEFGTIKVGFERPHAVQQVIIVENNDPGRITLVKLIDESGSSNIIYQQDPERVSDNFRTMVLSVAPTDYKVKSIEISINSIPVPGYSQIDAVGILEEGNLIDVKDLLSGANFNVQQIISFTASKELLQDQINSRFMEAKPIVSHDGNKLYFSRLFHPENIGGRSDPQDIYFSNLMGGQWTNAENIGFPLNDEFANGVCSISPDGRKLLLINGYLPDGSITPGVSISKLTPLGWSEPRKLNIEEYENQSKFQDYFLSADDEVMLLAIEQETGFGDQDLFLSFKRGENSYSKPINLGPTINTRKAEFAPFLSADNTTLYFASDGHSGYGQSDIYKVKRVDNSWKNWTIPQNLGAAINTSSREAYFSITASGNYAYFVSSEGGHKRQQNIFRIPLTQDASLVQGSDLIAFQGRVFDASTHEPIEASITIQNLTNKHSVQCNSDELSGNFLKYLSNESEHQLSVAANGYLTDVEQISINSLQVDGRVYKDIFLYPIEDGLSTAIRDLMFERGKAILLSSSYPSLENLVSILGKNPKINIELSGHTDGLGSERAKQELSYARVERIKEYLIMHGIEQKRVEIIGYGGSKPIAPNNNEENRAKNRRVEVRILDNDS